jgi:hypothetical protein
VEFHIFLCRNRVIPFPENLTICLAVGGHSAQALPAVAALMAAHTSITKVDGLHNGDCRFEARGWNKFAAQPSGQLLDEAVDRSR